MTSKAGQNVSVSGSHLAGLDFNCVPPEKVVDKVVTTGQLPMVRSSRPSGILSAAIGVAALHGIMPSCGVAKMEPGSGCVPFRCRSVSLGPQTTATRLGSQISGRENGPERDVALLPSAESQQVVSG